MGFWGNLVLAGICAVVFCTCYEFLTSLLRQYELERQKLSGPYEAGPPGVLTLDHITEQQKYRKEALGKLHRDMDGSQTLIFVLCSLLLLSAVFGLWGIVGLVRWMWVNTIW